MWNFPTKMAKNAENMGFCWWLSNYCKPCSFSKQQHAHSKSSRDDAVHLPLDETAERWIHAWVWKKFSIPIYAHWTRKCVLIVTFCVCVRPKGFTWDSGSNSSPGCNSSKATSKLLHLFEYTIHTRTDTHIYLRTNLSL